MANSSLPSFKLHFLYPRYWLIWIGLAFFRLILLLPYPILLKLGYGLGFIFTKIKVGQRRANIARRNLELAFPQMDSKTREELLRQNMQSVGMAIIETGMAWFWSDKRIKKWCSISGLEHLQNNAQGGAILVGIHFLTLELGPRVLGIEYPGTGIYRPNDNPLIDWIQYRGRARSNKKLLDRKDVRGMLKALKNNEIIWYAPDHDYGRKNAVFVPFFAVPDAATTTGTFYLLNATDNVSIIPFAPLRKMDGTGYHIEISPAIHLEKNQTKEQIASEINKIVEKEINKGLSQYMWLHRRFKTRPDENMPSYYN